MSYSNIGSNDVASGNLLADTFNRIQNQLNAMLMDKNNLANNVGRIHEAQASLSGAKRVQQVASALVQDIKQG